MISLVFVLLVLLVLALISTLCVYLLIHSRSSFRSFPKTETKQILRYSIRPSMDIITRKLNCDSPYRLSMSSMMSRRSSLLNPIADEHELDLNKTERSATPLRSANHSYSLSNNLFVPETPIHRRQSAIIDSKQISQIQFSLPPTTETYRRRSVAICNNLFESKQSTIDSIIQTIKSSNQFLPCLLTFLITHTSTSDLKIDFQSILSLPINVILQQLVIKVKLIPDGKVKYLELKKILDQDRIFMDDQQEYSIQFSNVSSAKLMDKAIVMKIDGKDRQKKHIHFGQVGKIYFNQLKDFQPNKSFEFIHEIEHIKTSSIEVLVSLEQTNDQILIVGLQQAKGLKVDQKNLSSTGFFRIVLLDRHRPLSTHQTKSHRLNSSKLCLNESFHFNILAFNANNFNRLMIIIQFFSNQNSKTHEHSCIGRVKLASPYLSAGSGTQHWEQFTERKSFSMWHTLIKQTD